MGCASVCAPSFISVSSRADSRSYLARRRAVQPVLEVRRVSKSFDRRNVILKDVSFVLARGEMVALIGASGSGKSTLIRAIAGLVPIDRTLGRPADASADRPDGPGEIILFGQPMQRDGRISSAAKELRVRVGVIFQQFNLVPRLSVLTNVCLGLLGRVPFMQGTIGRFSTADKRRALNALDRVGIAAHALKRGSDLSGGQQQRAAIARTLVQGAELVIADEPIASLDPRSARRVMDILADMNRHDRITVLVSLHQVEFALRYCPRAIALKAGEIVFDGPTRELTPALLGAIYGADLDELLLDSGDFPAPRRELPVAIPAAARFGDSPAATADPERRRA
ncbi:MAG: phosphonate ABC transporter ATP-binding protein [Xanthobacteraceae bacterium]|nr:phosphonate ABC transporter ATP-binding protein [Xanthobacteraceae bacterium]